MKLTFLIISILLNSISVLANSADSSHTYSSLSANIPDTPTECFNIKDGVLLSYECEHILNVKIPDEVTSIYSFAFYNMGIKNVHIPNSVESIGQRAFGLNRLTSVIIPNSVTHLGMGAFEQNRLTSVNIPTSINFISDFAFNTNKIEVVNIPSTVSYIGDGAFADNPLDSVQIPRNISLMNIGYGAFDSDVLLDIKRSEAYLSQGYEVYSCSDIFLHQMEIGTLCETSEGVIFKRLSNGIEELSRGIILSDEIYKGRGPKNESEYCKRRRLKLPSYEDFQHLQNSAYNEAIYSIFQGTFTWSFARSRPVYGYHTRASDGSIKGHIGSDDYFSERTSYICIK